MISRALIAAVLLVAAAPGVAQGLDGARFCEAAATRESQLEAEAQAQRLAALDSQIKARIAQLEERRAAFEDVMRRREEMMAKAEAGVVAIYGRMKPEAAAAQLAAMEEEAASAVLAKLGARAASTILAEIEAGHAARLAAGLARASARPSRPQP